MIVTVTVIVISAAQTLWGEKETDIEDITSQVREIDQAVNTFECGYDVSLRHCLSDANFYKIVHWYKTRYLLADVVLSSILP